MPAVVSRSCVALLALLVLVSSCSTASAPAPAPAPPPAATSAPAPAQAVQAPAPAAPPEPVVVRQAAQTGAAGVVLWLAEERGYLRQEGITIEPIAFSNASETIPALATGQVDLSPMPANPAMWNAVAR